VTGEHPIERGTGREDRHEDAPRHESLGGIPNKLVLSPHPVLGKIRGVHHHQRQGAVRESDVLPGRDDKVHPWETLLGYLGPLLTEFNSEKSPYSLKGGEKISLACGGV
jgi:hypothetical protein